MFEADAAAAGVAHSLRSTKDASLTDEDHGTSLYGREPAMRRVEATEEVLLALEHAVQHTDNGLQHDLDAHTKADKASRHPWLAKVVPALQKLEAREHLGNYVMTRGPRAEKKWESMPIYVRLGMHALFVSTNSIGLTKMKRVERLLEDQSIKEGKIFDSREGAEQRIRAFIDTYELKSTLPELLEPDPAKYATFNSFFSRQLKAGARPAASPDDPSVITSAADCRLTAYESVDQAKKIWIKGQNFTLPTLFDDEALARDPAFIHGAALAIFRLAPSDYHRFHSPVSCSIESTRRVPGCYYTVNPQAVNENFDVFTSNKRDVMTLSVPRSNASQPPRKVVYVAIGAMLVGSIAWTRKDGDQVKKGDELGYFAYGGSTVIVAFPAGSVTFDEDLVRNSNAAIETQVRVGERIGMFL